MDGREPAGTGVGYAKCDHCRFSRGTTVLDDKGDIWYALNDCRLVNACMFLDAVESGHPFLEVTDECGAYVVIIDELDRGEGYIREHLPYGYTIIDH